MTENNAAQPGLNDTIRAVFLEHGFTIKHGQTDLKPYVYEAVHALLFKLRAPVADERAAVDPCGCVAVKVSAVDWLKDKFPALTIKAGLCERIGGRLYTITRLMRDHDAAQASEK